MELRFTDEGDGLPVLFLHAFPYHRGQWEGQRVTLRGKARFMSLDVRGMGPGAAAPSAYLLEHLVDDVIALLDQRGVASALLCGCSMGGYVALRVAEREPSRVRGLLLVDTQAAADTDAAKLGRAGALRTLVGKGTQAFADAQLDRQLSPKASPAVRADLQALIAQSSPEGISAALVALATRTDTQSALANLRMPVQLVVGADDTITTPELMRSVQSAIPGAKLHILQGAGHIPNVEAPSQFDPLLLQLVAQLS